MNRNGFSMIELVFVIAVLGILAAVAIPKLAVTRTDALIATGKADIAAIRSGIITERQTRLVKGDSAFIAGADLSSAAKLFDGVMMYGITPRTGTGSGWAGSGTAYTYKAGGTTTAFTYNPANGKFTCTAGAGDCDKLTD